MPAVVGISFHDGALVTNYPWDGEPDIASGVYAASPDDSLFISMGSFLYDFEVFIMLTCHDRKVLFTNSEDTIKLKSKLSKLFQ